MKKLEDNGKNEIKFNLFDLHSHGDDFTIRQCLRAFTVLPKYCGFLDERNENSKEIITNLKRIDKKASEKFGIGWRKKWVEKIGLDVTIKSTYEWTRGKSPIPLIALQKLDSMGFEQELGAIMGKITHISSCTQEIVKMPKVPTSGLLYLTGLILSDGYLQKTKRKNQHNFEYGVHIYSGDERVLKSHVIPLIKTLFGFACIKLTYKHGAWALSKRNKVLFRFFTRILGLPYGKKSVKCRIPQIVWDIGPEKTIPFLAGLVDGDVGKHGKGMGGTFRSEKFVDDMVLYLDKIGVKATKRKTNILKSGHIQNEFYIAKKEVAVLKDIMAKNFLPKRLDRLNTLFCRGTKAV